MNSSLKRDRQKYTANCCVHIEVFQIIRRFPIINPYDREDLLHVHSLVIFGNDVAKFDFWVLNLLEFVEFSGHPWYSVATSFPVLMNSWASLCQPWELHAASGLEFRFLLASSLPENPTCRLENCPLSTIFKPVSQHNLDHFWSSGSCPNLCS